ncbi:hypothetical protein KUTeg_000641 [Tegillarca granosa]|uniref:Uncharacterized protein n=1 Tax=Tegillarca granosa TaxID=220873 RepID=A0ABQ9G2G5_TEGGR|nr:hypothetical protein KUTeg_000641 [Tegillarca granosa]
MNKSINQSIHQSELINSTQLKLKLNSTQLNSTQLNSTQLNSTQLNSSNQIESNQIIKSSQVKSNQIKSNQIKEENALFSGDNVLGEGTTVFEDLHSYMSSLNKALEFKPSIIYPSHGPVVNDPIERVTDYIKHRNQREEQIIAALQENSESALSSMDLVDIIYVVSINRPTK